MNAIHFSDWQDMAIKKDIERINSKITIHDNLMLTFCIEFVITVLSVLADRILDNGIPASVIWIIIASFVIVPLMAMLPPAVKFIKNYRSVKNGHYKIKPLIDLFDNQICYWVMIGGSFSKMVSELVDKNGEEAERVFFYQEGCYYINKSIEGLYSMQPAIDKIFYDDLKQFKSSSNRIFSRDGIDLYRLFGILDLIRVYQRELNQSITDVKEKKAIEAQMSINNTWEEELKSFIETINETTHNQYSLETHFSDGLK